MFRPILVVAFVIEPATAMAQEANVDALLNAMRMDEVLEIVRDEGLEEAETMAENLFPGTPGRAWRSAVEDIYGDDLGPRFSAAFGDALGDTDVQPLTSFFASAQGQEILDLELEARRAIADPDVEQAAGEAAEDLMASGAPLMQQVDAYIEVNDLVEQNTIGAMNASMAFYSGLAEGNAFGGAMTESDIVADVYAQMPSLRAETEDWLYAYLTMAYRPLDPSTLDAYVAMSESEAGQALNAAIFAAFDRVYIDISRALGRRAAAFMSGQDI